MQNPHIYIRLFYNRNGNQIFRHSHGGLIHYNVYAQGVDLGSAPTYHEAQAKLRLTH